MNAVETPSDKASAKSMMTADAMAVLTEQDTNM